MLWLELLNNSELFVAVTTKHSCNVNCEVSLENAYKVAKTIFKTVQGKEIIYFTKYNVYTDSKRYKSLVSQGIDIVEKISREPFEEILNEQRVF